MWGRLGTVKTVDGWNKGIFREPRVVRWELQGEVEDGWLENLEFSCDFAFRTLSLSIGGPIVFFDRKVSKYFCFYIFAIILILDNVRILRDLYSFNWSL